jgi:hypothetical protein
MSESVRAKERSWRDPIVAEVRATRQQLLAQVGYDLHALCELLRSHQAAEGREIVRRSPRPSCDSGERHPDRPMIESSAT